MVFPQVTVAIFKTVCEPVTVSGIDADRLDPYLIKEPGFSIAAVLGFVSVIVIVPMFGCSCVVSIWALKETVFVPIVVFPFLVTQVMVPASVLEVEEKLDRIVFGTSKVVDVSTAVFVSVYEPIVQVISCLKLVDFLLVATVIVFATDASTIGFGEIVGTLALGMVGRD